MPYSPIQRTTQRSPIDPPLSGISPGQERWGRGLYRRSEPKTHSATPFARMFMSGLLILCPEGIFVKSRPAGSLSMIESEVIAEIRALRASPSGGLKASLLMNPAQLAHHFIVASHGNVQLRFSTIATELGVEMRTLERAFVGEYEMTMTQFQVEVRLAFSHLLLSIFPPTKVSAIASLLGYRLVQDFNRFFKKHMQQSPSEWGRKERAKMMRAERGTPYD